MKIADVKVGTEYAKVGYARRNETDWSALERASRVLVTAIGKGGAITVADYDQAAGKFRDGSYGSTAKTLVMPWAEAEPELAKMREAQARSAVLRREQLAREQEALRFIGKVIDGLDIKNLPYNLEPAIALANGHETRENGSWGPTKNSHAAKVEIPVVVLAELLDAAIAKACYTG